MKPNEKTNLSIANELSRQGKYASALVYYQRTIAETPSLAGHLKFNIENCRNNLKNDGQENTVINPEAGGELNAIKELLRTEFDGRVRFPMPGRSIIRTHLESLVHQTPGLHHLKAVVLCALASPYQRALLCHLNALLEKLKLKYLVDDNQSQRVSLAMLTRLASSHTYWLMNRWQIKEQVGVNSDPRLLNLLWNPPAYPRTEYLNPNELRSYTWDAYPNTRHVSGNVNGSYRVTFGTILLNEAKFIGMNLMQHYDLCDEWILVEGACQGYPTRKVSSDGLSLDNSAAQIQIFPDPLNKIRFIQHGWTKAQGENAKSELRNEYIKYCRSDVLAVVDADEFYRLEDFQSALEELNDSKVFAVTLPQVHFWKKTSHFITGEYYDIAHTRIFRYIPGMKYISNHNFPEIGGKTGPMLGHKKIARTLKEIETGGYSYGVPCCYHMGFAKDADDMRDKSDYYINRGEATTRPVTTASRDAWFTNNLPEKCHVKVWSGELPEVLKVEIL